MRRRGLGIRLLVALLILLAVVLALVAADIQYTTWRAEQQQPEPPAPEAPSTEVE